MFVSRLHVCLESFRAWCYDAPANVVREGRRRPTELYEGPMCCLFCVYCSREPRCEAFIQAAEQEVVCGVACDDCI